MTTTAGPIQRLPTEFFERSVHEVARDLIGCTVAHGDTAGVIVETESYHADDPACHAFGGPTPRSSVLFGPPAHAYVYLSYGIHSLLNFVAEPEGEAAAVLIRALEPDGGRRHDAGPARLRAHRGPVLWPGEADRGARHRARPERRPARPGPDRGAGRASPGGHDPAIVTGPRIGITKAIEHPWRFSAAGSRFVSKPWPQPGA